MRDRGKSVISKWRTETYRRSRLHGPSIETNSADTLISDFWSLELWEGQCLMFYPLESLGLQRRSNQSILKEISPEYSLEGLMLKLKLQYLATWCEEPTHWERPWCWERLKAGEGDDRGWDGWMASPTWVWASSGSWWWTGKPGVLQSMGSQRVRHNWATELNWMCFTHFICGTLLQHP